MERLDPLKISADEFWSKFQRTDQIVVPKRLRDWLIGQDDVLERLELGLEQFERKMLTINEEKRRGEDTKRVIRERPGPYYLLIGKPGTGKSLIGKILREELAGRFKAKGIEVYDVLCLKNPRDPNRPRILTCRAGLGEKYVDWRTRVAVAKTQRKLNFLRNFFVGILGSFGMFLILWVLALFLQNSLSLLALGLPLQSALTSATEVLISHAMMLTIGAQLLMGAAFTYWIMSMMGGGGVCSGILKNAMLKEYADSPAVIVNNSSGEPPFIQNLSTNPSEILGDIGWDPYQHPGLSIPINKRVTAGDIHRANGGIFFLDEFKTMSEEVAIRLLTAMEDGEYPISFQGSHQQAGTAALNLRTDPVPCVFFLLAAGNEDILSDPGSILNRLPQFRNRFQYGGIIYMNHDVEDTLHNRMKIAQFVADEAQRFGLLPFSREAVEAVIDYLRRRAQRKDRISIELRYALGLLQEASNLAMREGCDLIYREHIEEARYLRRPVETQRIEKMFESLKSIKKIRTVGSEIGRINGLAVVQSPSAEEGVGEVIAIKVVMEKTEKGQGNLVVTGIAKTPEHNALIENSIAMVRTAILKKFKVDIAKDYYTHIDFVQAEKVDGPSAGISMLLAIESCLLNIPLRQDIAVTGKIELLDEEPNKIIISAVGGIFEKIEAAEKWGLKAVVIPTDSYINHPISEDPQKYRIRILHGCADDEYLEMLKDYTVEEAKIFGRR